MELGPAPHSPRARARARTRKRARSLSPNRIKHSENRTKLSKLINNDFATSLVGLSHLERILFRARVRLRARAHQLGWVK